MEDLKIILQAAFEMYVCIMLGLFVGLLVIVTLVGLGNLAQYVGLL